MKCRRCGLNNVLNESGVLRCISCGYEITSTLHRHLFIQENRLEIAQDFLLTGPRETMKKWGMSSSTLYNLPEVRLTKKNTYRTKNGGSLPALPDWQESWPDEVKKKWLEIYNRKLVGV